jgi:DNA-binding winged helix-turn-helix (wHTH) protein
MVELKDQEDGRIALIMDKEELPFAVEALMRAGYELTPPSEDGAEEDEEPEDQAEEPEEPEELEDEAEEDEVQDEEPEEVEGRGPVRRRGSRARRL